MIKEKLFLTTFVNRKQNYFVSKWNNRKFVIFAKVNFIKEKNMITLISQLDLTKKYTYSDYLTWQFDEMVELIKGKLLRMSPAPSRKHQEYSGNIFWAIRTYLNQKSCKVYEAPFDVRLVINKKEAFHQIETVVQPDICVICDLEKLDDFGCSGSPDFIIEVVSKTSKKRDYHDKYDLYEENGVLEYWIVDPEGKTVDVFVLENGKYEQRGNFFTPKDSITSVVLPDFVILWDDIFRD